MTLKLNFFKSFKVARHLQKCRLLCKNSVKKPDFYSTLFHHDKKFAPIVIPNFDNIDFEKIKKSVKLRSMNLNVDDLEELFSKYDKVNKEWRVLNEEKNLFLLNYKENKSGSLDDARTIRAKLRSLNTIKTELKNDITLRMLSMPNEMEHSINNDWSSSFVGAPGETVTNRVATVCRDDVVATDNCNMAMPKYVIMEHSYDWWQSQGYVPISLSDMCKTAVIEACTNNVFGGQQVALCNNKLTNDDGDVNCNNILFLSGSSSLEAFCGYLLRTRTASKCMPMKLMSLGNSYMNSDGEVKQNYVLSCLLATATLEHMERELTYLLDHIRQYWTTHFDIQVNGSSVSSLSKLNKHESHRYVIRCRENVELARVSVIGDYISRRLMINSNNDTPLYLVYASLCDFNSICLSVLKHDRDINFRYNSDWIDDIDTIK